MSHANVSENLTGEKTWYKTVRASSHRTPAGVIRSFVRRVRFENEQRIYEIIANDASLIGRAPSVIKNNLGRELVLADTSPVEPLKIWTERGDLAHLLAAFNCVTATLLQRPFHHEFVMRATGSRLIQALRDALRCATKYLSIKETIKLFCLLIHLQYSVPKQERALLLHNDLHSGNILENALSGSVNLLDFELAALERTWILTDIVSAVLNRQTFTIDARVLRIFLDAISYKVRIALSTAELKAQVRFGAVLRMYAWHAFSISCIGGKTLKIR